MALPFFHKDRNKSESEPLIADSGSHTTSLNSGLATIGTGIPMQHGIVLEEIGGGADTAIGEIAILYASGQNDNIETTLNALLAENNLRIWHMLFDYYRLNQRQSDFDRLGLDYAMRFESSPPAWAAGEKTDANSKQETARLLVLPSRLDDSTTGKLGNILSSLDKNSVLQLDFSKVTEINPQGTQGVSDMLAASRKHKIKFQVSGASSMIDLLRSRMYAEPGVQPYWLMLMAIYQLLGKQTEFEDMAVDFAVAFEISPPSWETVQAAEEVAAPEPEIPKDAFSLSGVVSEASREQISHLMQYAQSRKQIVVDCSAVTRVDYAYIGQLIGQLMQLLGEGKTLTLQGQNALINELFCTMGIDQLANLIPAKLG